MHSMTQGVWVVGGVDAHADSHHAAVLDERGRLVGSQRFAATTVGYGQLLAWLRGFGALEGVGVESTGSYAAGLVRYLRERQVRVVEVNQPHPHSRRRVGKSDRIDAELAARLLVAGKATAVPKQTDGIVESIRVLRVARASAVKARSAALVQLRDLIITAPAPLREQLAHPSALEAKARVCARLRPARDQLAAPEQATKLALRSLGQRIALLGQEIAGLDRELAPLVRRAAPRTTQLLGISTGHAGQFLVSAGQNLERLKGESSFAALCGANPIPASSGKTIRHRLNPGGDRQANRSLHLIAVCRLRYCPRTQAYAQRRAQDGKTNREIMRCLKRYIAREIYNTLHTDLTNLPTPTPDNRPQPHPQSTAILCGNPSHSITRYRA